MREDRELRWNNRDGRLQSDDRGTSLRGPRGALLLSGRKDRACLLSEWNREVWNCFRSFTVEGEAYIDFVRLMDAFIEGPGSLGL